MVTSSSEASGEPLTSRVRNRGAQARGRGARARGRRTQTNRAVVERARRGRIKERILDLRDLLASLHGRLGDGFETRDRDIDYRDIDYRDMNMEQTLDETVALLRDMLRNVDKRDRMLGSNGDNDYD